MTEYAIRLKKTGKRMYPVPPAAAEEFRRSPESKLIELVCRTDPSKEWEKVEHVHD